MKKGQLFKNILSSVCWQCTDNQLHKSLVPVQSYISFSSDTKDSGQNIWYNPINQRCQILITAHEVYAWLERAQNIRFRYFKNVPTIPNTILSFICSGVLF